MAVRKQQPKKNIAGFLDPSGMFHPIRKPEYVGKSKTPATAKDKRQYSPKKAGDKDDVFDKEIRKLKNQKKAEEIWEKRLMDEALDNALGEESKVSLTQFVRRQGGLRFDPKSNEPYNGELENLSFKQSKVRGLAHPKGKYSLDGMREAADLAGYGDPNGDPLTTINQFLDALESDMRGKKIYPFGNIGSYKFNPSTHSKFLLKKQVTQINRVIRKLQKQKGKARKIANLVKVRDLAQKLANSPAKPTLKKNGLLTAFAELAVGTSAAVGLYDRFKEQKEVKPKNSNRNYVGLKENKGKEISPAQQKSIHERNFQKFLVAIESGDLSKEPLAKIQGKLAGHEANEVSRAIQYARLTYKLKQNPSVGILKQAENLISKVKSQLKINGIVGRVLARHKAGKLYKRQLRLEAAIDRAKKKRSAAEARAKKNPYQFYADKPLVALLNKVYQNGKNLIDAKKLTQRESWRVFDSPMYFEHNGEKCWLKNDGIKLLKNKKLHRNPEKLRISPSFERYGKGHKFDNKQDALYKGQKVWILNALLKMLNKDFVYRVMTDDARLLQVVEKDLKPFSIATKKNPAKIQSKAFEDFQGRKPTKLLNLPRPEDAPQNLWSLGTLLELRLKGQPNLNFRREVTGKTFYLCADEKNKQLWICGGKVATPNNSIQKGYSEPYALITHIVYETKKVHLGDTDEEGYIHEFGEEGGQQPTLAFDRNGFPIIVAGSYTITPLGIAD